MFPELSSQVVLNGFANLFRLKKIIPYASVRGLNRTAVKVQGHIVNTLLPGKFVLRNKWYAPRSRYGFNIQFANLETQEARVGTQAEWMKLQEEGGKKEPTRASSVAIPQAGIRPNVRDILRKRMRPPAQFRRASVFALRTDRGTAMYERTKAGGLKLLYGFKKAVNIRATFEMVKTETETIQRVYHDEYYKAILEFLSKP